MRSTVKVRPSLRGAALIVVLGILMVDAPAVVSAESDRSVEARCDGRKAAETVTRELETISILPPNLSGNHLRMREPHEAPADHRIYYGSNAQQFGDLRLPKGRGPFPVAVVIHGGAWSAFSTLDYMAPIAASLACAGVATWNIEYRRLGSGGEWPGLFEDVAAATDFLRKLARVYPLDLSLGVVSIGHSAGGHLALWLATRHLLPSESDLSFGSNPLPISGAVSLDGVMDLPEFLKDTPQFEGSFEQLFGADSLTAEFSRRMRDTSSEAHLPLGVRQLLIQGDPGGLPPVGCCGIPEYAEKAQALGDDITYLVIDGFHFESVDPANDEAGPVVRSMVRSMLGLQ